MLVRVSSVHQVPSSEESYLHYAIVNLSGHPRNPDRILLSQILRRRSLLRLLQYKRNTHALARRKALACLVKETGTISSLPGNDETVALLRIEISNGAKGAPFI